MVEYFLKSERLQKKNKKQLITLAMSSSEKKKRKQNNSKKKEKFERSSQKVNPWLWLGCASLKPLRHLAVTFYYFKVDIRIKTRVSLEQTFEVCRSVLIFH